jgi:DNA-binding Lrp family transcriptional regulator
MQNIEIDHFDIAILRALQRNSAHTNAELADIVHLSPSQCSRRRQRLEVIGIIEGYTSRLNASKLGFGLKAITRVNLSAHSELNAEKFASFLKRQDEVRAAFSVSGEADYVLIITTTDLASFAELIHSRILPYPQVQYVRSEIVLKVLKEDEGLPLAASTVT